MQQPHIVPGSYATLLVTRRKRFWFSREKNVLVFHSDDYDLLYSLAEQWDMDRYRVSIGHYAEF